MFKKRAAVFYRGFKTRGVAFKNIPQRACPSGLKTMVQIVRGEY